MDNCIFCALAEKRLQPWLVMENETCLAFLDANPISPYHTLVIPKQHYVGMLDVPAGTLGDVTDLIRQVCRLYEEKLGIDSFQIFNNTGPHSMQTVFHLHFHILPRFENDAISFNATKQPELVEKYPEMLEKLKLNSWHLPGTLHLALVPIPALALGSIELPVFFCFLLPVSRFLL